MRCLFLVNLQFHSPGLTRLLGSKNAADLNVLLSSELCLGEGILQSCTSALERFVEHLNTKLKSQNEFKEILIVSFLISI